jgi:hypothetical protein
VQILEPSVSRVHLYMSVSESGEITIKDNCSTFGTYIQTGQKGLVRVSGKASVLVGSLTQIDFNLTHVAYP